MGGRDGADLGDGHLPVREHLEHEGLELLVGAIDLVHQEHRRLLALGDGLEQRAAQEELLGEDLVLGLIRRTPPRPRSA